MDGAKVPGGVGLREVSGSDLETLFAYEQDPEATGRSRFPPRDHDAFINHWRTVVLGDATVLARAVVVGGDLAGSVVSWWSGDRRFIGYWLGRPFWGRGVGTAALGLFLCEEKVRPLYADPFESNTASVRLLERCGFERVGTDGEQVMLVLR